MTSLHHRRVRGETLTETELQALEHHLTECDATEMRLLVAHQTRQYEEGIREVRDVRIDRRFAAMEAEIALLRRQLGERQ